MPEISKYINDKTINKINSSKSKDKFKFATIYEIERTEKSNMF